MYHEPKIIEQSIQRTQRLLDDLHRQHDDLNRHGSDPHAIAALARAIDAAERILKIVSAPPTGEPRDRHDTA